MTTTRTRKLLDPSHGVCRWIVQLTDDHAGMLEITTTSTVKPVCEVYRVESCRDGQCRWWKLTRETGRGAPQTYDLARDLSACDCADATFAGERPGGCKHRRALQVALTALFDDHQGMSF